MHREILEALKAKFSGVSETVLSRIANKLAKTITKAEDVQTATDGVTIQQVIDAYADGRATEESTTAVRNYEAKHNLKEGKAVVAEPEPQKQGDDGEMPAWAKALVESNKALSQEVKTLQAEKISTARRDQINNIIGKLPASLRKSYERTSVENLSDEEFESLKTEITSEVEEITKENNARGVVFGRPNAGAVALSTSGKVEASEEETKELAAAMGL